MRKQQRLWGLLILLSLCAFALQGCLGIGDSPSSHSGGANPTAVSVAQNVFSGKIYATAGHNLFVISGDGSSKKLLDGGNIYDPAVSPDGSQLAFIRRFKNYSDLDLMSTSGGKVRTLISGNGSYFFNQGGFIHSKAYWFFKPAWSRDGSKILFLSDYIKLEYQLQYHPNQDADMLDLMVFSIPVKDPTQITALAYTSFGGGGDSDPSYNPANANQIVYTHYGPLTSDGSQQQVQLMLADARMIAENPGKYKAAATDTGIAITAAKYQNIQPAYSPDGQFLAYVRSENVTNTAIYVMPVATGVTANPNDAATEQRALQPYQKSVKLLEGIYYSRPTWSPTGKQMAYLVERNEELDIWVINLNFNAASGVYSVQGSEVQVTTSGIDGDSRFSWSK